MTGCKFYKDLRTIIQRVHRHGRFNYISIIYYSLLFTRQKTLQRKSLLHEIKIDYLFLIISKLCFFKRL